MPTMAGGQLQGILLRDRRNAENAQAMEMARYRQAQMESMANRDRAMDFQNQLAGRRMELEEAQYAQNEPYNQARLEHMQSQNKAINFQNAQSQRAMDEQASLDEAYNTGLADLIYSFSENSTPEGIGAAVDAFSKKSGVDIAGAVHKTRNGQRGIEIYLGDEPEPIFINHSTIRKIRNEYENRRIQEEQARVNIESKQARAVSDQLKLYYKQLADLNDFNKSMNMDSKQKDEQIKNIQLRIKELESKSPVAHDAEGNALGIKNIPTMPDVNTSVSNGKSESVPDVLGDIYRKRMASSNETTQSKQPSIAVKELRGVHTDPKTGKRRRAIFDANTEKFIKWDD